MADQISSSLTVTDPKQAALMAHPHFSPLLDALMGREGRVSELAGQLGWPLDQTHYRVGRLCRAGLLRVIRQEKRAGRPVKVYRAVADAFFVPYAAWPSVTLEEKFLRHELKVARALVRSLVRLLQKEVPRIENLGPYLYRTTTGELREDLALGPAESLDLARTFPTATEHLRPLTLTPTQVLELRAELDHLAARFPSQKEGQAMTHMLRLWLTPACREDWAELTP